MTAEARRAFAEFTRATGECERLGLEWESDPTDERLAELSAAMRRALLPAAAVADALGQHQAADLWRSIADLGHLSVLSVWGALIAHMDRLLGVDDESTS